MSRDLPDPFRDLFKGLESILDRAACLWSPCRYTPQRTISRSVYKSMPVIHATYCCVRCGKARTMTLLKAILWEVKHTSWDHYKP